MECFTVKIVTAKKRTIAHCYLESASYLLWLVVKR